MGNAYDALGQYERAIDFHQQSLAIQQEIGDRQGEAGSLGNLGVAYESLGQYELAVTMLQQSMLAFESLRTNLPDDQLISLLDTQSTAYANLGRTLVSQEKTSEALAVAERGRSQAFALQLTSRLSEAESQTLQDSETASFPSLEEIQKVARDTNTTLVEYALIYNKALYIWVVQPSGNIEFRSVEFDGAGETAFAALSDIDGPIYRSAQAPSELDTLVSNTRVATISATTNDAGKLKDLHQALIDPIADLLPTDPTAKVAFIPQGDLFLVPFPALQDSEGTYLIEKHTILTAPSIQVLGLAHEAAKDRAVTAEALVVGNPTIPVVTVPTDSGELADVQLADLPGTEAEARAIAQLLNTTPLIGSEATEARIKAQLPTAGIIHLATHGLLDYGDPQTSGVRDLPGAIALTPGNGEDGLLTSAEIYGMTLQADLAILSACDTGRGRITGDGVVGLSRSLITAGVPSTIVSLWAVPDAPTAELMTEFYRQRQQGQDKAQALRQAMLKTMAAHPEPRNWAAFTLIGDGS